MNQIEFYHQKIQQAKDLKSWRWLIPYPRLLCKWQNDNPKDCISIAKYSAHKLGIKRALGLLPEDAWKKDNPQAYMDSRSPYHTWCDTPETCKKINNFAKKSLRELLVRTLQQAVKDHKQQALI